MSQHVSEWLNVECSANDIQNQKAPKHKSPYSVAWELLLLIEAYNLLLTSKLNNSMKILIWDNNRGGWIRYNNVITQDHTMAESFDSIKDAEHFAIDHKIDFFQLFIKIV